MLTMKSITPLSQSRHMIDTFLGYNHNLRIGGSEFYDMKNMTSDQYPLLSPRGKRGIYAVPASANGLISKDGLCYVDGNTFYINQKPVAGLILEDSPKELISMGAYVIIMPDKKYINTADLTEYGNIEAEFTTQEEVSFELCTLDGSAYAIAYTQATEPTAPENMAYWLDTSSVPNSLKQWSEVNGMWVGVGTTYVKIKSPGIGAAFEQYDGVTISGLAGVLTDKITGEEIADSADIAALEGAAVVWAKDADYIVVVGILDQARTITNPVTISRKMPDMDFIVESNNRLWGCRYGLDAEGETVNILYASKLGDFKNWSCYMGQADDSYYANLGTDGKFTGAVAHHYPIFFKENVMHVVYGTEPSNFQVQDTPCRGVQDGCHKSLAVVNETLFYKSRQCVCAYDGSLPVEASSAFGEVLYGNAVGGAHGNKYYISMQDTNGNWHLMVYDTAKGMWHREDDTQVSAFCSCRGEMYFIDTATGQIRTSFGSGEPAEDAVEWMVESGVIGTDSPDAKYISKLLIRMMLNVGAEVSFHIDYDSAGDWHELGSVTGNSLRSFQIPIRPRRCDHFRIRISGKGDAKIFSITKTIEEGSEKP